MISLKKGIKSLSKNILHEYYTPKPTKFQGILVIFTIFVNYADFYVNIIMSTQITSPIHFFIIFDYFATYCAPIQASALNIGYASFLSLLHHGVN